jgi:gliding motility-associated-like protein
MVRLIFILVFIAPGLIFGQVTLDRQVIGSAGIDGSGSVLISSTAGQPEYTTGSNANGIISQGFQQPPSEFIEPSFSLNLPPCAGEEAALLLINLEQCVEALIYIDGQELGGDEVMLEEGMYELVVVGDGCYLNDSIEVNFEQIPICDIIFFTGFSPNGDDLNDSWIIENIEFSAHSTNRVVIYSRWGDLVWEGVDYNNTDSVFNGVSRDGVLLPAAVYYYIFESGDYSKNGFIELMR